MEQKMDLSMMTDKQKEQLFAQLENERKNARVQKRDAYEALRAQFVAEVETKTTDVVGIVKAFHEWLEKESAAFTEVMKEYGQVKSSEQMSFTISDGDFRLEMKANKVKGFDERADMAAERLISYLKQYIKDSEKGVNDPIYQMAMTLLERNKMGDLDYKSISKLYELEDQFDAEYGAIMDLFKEANIVQRNAMNYYFSRRDKNGVWLRVEPSFCRM